jgi:outer membrane protein TolC
MNLIKNILIFILIPTTFYAQNERKIDFYSFLEKVKKNNIKNINAYQDYKIAKADAKSANALFLPNINISLTGMSTNSPLMAFGTKLNQKTVTMMDFNPDLLNNPESIQNLNTRIDVIQPLINLDGFYGRQAAIEKSNATRWQALRFEQYIELEAYKSYLMLQLAYKAEHVLTMANQTANENMTLVENYYKNGMIQKADLLNAQVRVGEIKNQFQMVKSNVKNASDQVLYMMNENEEQVLKPTESLDSNIEVQIFKNQIPEDRFDIKAMESATNAYSNLAKMSTFNMLPRLNAFGSYEWNDKKITGFGASNYMVGLQLGWNIFDGSKSLHKNEKAKLEFQKAKNDLEEYKNQNQLELNKTIRQLNDLEQKVSLYNLAWNQSKEAYKIRKNRFVQGLEKTNDLMMSETLMYQKELEYLQTIFEYNFTKKYLEFLTK